MAMGSLGRLAAGVGFSLMALGGRAAAQGAGADPWSRVPALPASCYKDDDLEARINAAATSNDADWTRQNDVNSRIKAKLDAIDPGEKMQRIQAYMMRNPQDAMRAMQAMQAQGAGATSAIVGGQDELARLEQELNADTANFRAAAARVRDPIQSEIDELVRTKGKVTDEAGGISLPAADLPRYRALNARLNSDYERMCGAWWGPNGTFPGWLRRFKEYQVRSVVAAGDTAVAGTISMMTMLGVPSAGYRSTAALGAVHDYLYKMNVIYQRRLWRVKTD